MNHLMKGVLLILLGYLCNALMSVCAKTLVHTVPMTTIVMFQYWAAALLTLPAIIKNGLSTIKTERLGLMLLRCSTGITSFLALFFSIKYLPLVNSVLLQNTYPLFLPIVIWLWLRQAIPKKIWASILIGFLGIILILKPNATIIHPAAIIGLLGGVVSAVSVTCIALLKKTEPTQRILFYTFLPGAILMTPFLFHDVTHLTFPIIIALIGVGSFLYLAQMFIAMSFHYAKASVLAPFCYSAVVFSGLLGWLFWDDVPDSIGFLGIGLVSIGGIITIVLEQRSKKMEISAADEALENTKAKI